MQQNYTLDTPHTHTLGATTQPSDDLPEIRVDPSVIARAAQADAQREADASCKRCVGLCVTSGFTVLGLIVFLVSCYRNSIFVAILSALGTMVCFSQSCLLLCCCEVCGTEETPVAPVEARCVACGTSKESHLGEHPRYAGHRFCDSCAQSLGICCRCDERFPPGNGETLCRTHRALLERQCPYCKQERIFVIDPIGGPHYGALLHCCPGCACLHHVCMDCGTGELTTDRLCSNHHASRTQRHVCSFCRNGRIVYNEWSRAWNYCCSSCASSCRICLICGGGHECGHMRVYEAYQEHQRWKEVQQRRLEEQLRENRIKELAISEHQLADYVAREKMKYGQRDF